MHRVFLSYSHEDEHFRRELEKHLALLRRQGVIELWSDHCIRPGEQLDPAIAEALHRANFILLLISADFLHSEYCYSVEMTTAMQRHNNADATVVPIIVRPCDWKTAPFGGIKALPADGKPVIKWITVDEAMADIARELRELVKSSEIQLGPRGDTFRAGLDSGTQLIPNVPRSSNLALPRRYSDQDRHDFLLSTFSYIRSYFENSLTELEARNERYTSRLNRQADSAFKAVIFENGTRVAGCFIRIDSRSFNGTGIAYSGHESAEKNSHNELLSVASDENMLYLSAGMAMFHRPNEVAKLTQEGAAEHLWSLLIDAVRR